MGSWWNDFKSNAISLLSAKPQVATATFNGDGVDMTNAEIGLFALLQVGAVSGTNPTLDVTIEESDDNSTFTAVNDFRTGVAAAFAQITTADQIVALTFKRSKKFIRLVPTIGGSSPSFALAGSLHGLRKSRSTDEDLS